MNKIILLILGVVGTLLLLDNLTKSASNLVHERAMAKAYLIQVSSQARLDSAQAMFPFFVLGLIFLGLLLILIVWVMLAQQRNELIAQQIATMKDQNVIEKHYHTSEKILIAPRQNRREFYQQLAQPDPSRIITAKSQKVPSQHRLNY